MAIERPLICCIRPPIYAYHAFCPWLQPTGILQICAVLLEAGYDVKYIDCIGDGSGMIEAKATAPVLIRHYKRTYRRYGKKPDTVRKSISRVPDRVAGFYIGSGMTYWYTGVSEIREYIERYHKGKPCAIGGTYATLEPDHAKDLGFDYVVRGEGENSALEVAEKITGHYSSTRYNLKDLDSLPYPAWNLQGPMKNRTYRSGWLPLYWSRGCPYSCSYCASKITYNCGYRAKSPAKCIAELRHYIETYNVTNYTLNDDNLLLNADKHIKPILRKIIKLDSPRRLRFRTPNSTSAEMYDEELADLFYRAGVEQICVSLEVLEKSKQKEMGRHCQTEEIARAVKYLRDRGYKRKQIVTYILTGLPGQRVEAIIETILYAWRIGTLPMPLTFVPLRGTAEWNKCIERGFFDDTADPIIFSKGIIPIQSPAYTYQDAMTLKNWCNAMRKSIQLEIDLFAEDPLIEYARSVLVKWETAGVSRYIDIPDISATIDTQQAPAGLMAGDMSTRDQFREKQKIGNGSARFSSGFVKDTSAVYGINEVIQRLTGLSERTVKRLDTLTEPIFIDGKRHYSAKGVAIIHKAVELWNEGYRGKALKSRLQVYRVHNLDDLPDRPLQAQL